MNFKVLACTLPAIILMGCINDSERTVKDSQESLSLTPVLSSAELTEGASINGYIAKDGVELVYGLGVLASRVDGGDWTIETSNNFYGFGAEIVDSQHWIFGVARSASDGASSARRVVEQTIDAGTTWSSVDVAVDLDAYDFVGGFAYDYNQDQLFTSVDLGLAVTTLPNLEFEMLSEVSDFPNDSVKLLLNPNRDELWMIGALGIASGGGSVDTAYVKRFDLSESPIGTDDFSEAVEFSTVYGGLIYSNDPDVVLVSGSGGIMRTEDGGANWRHVLKNRNIHNVVESESGDRIYTAYLENEHVKVACSESMGNRWTASTVDTDSAVGVTLIERNGDKLILGFDRESLHAVALSDIPCER
ncbi:MULTISPECIES: hypothetical protein [Gammaproteobacteria]|uniref:hypothetical protein n=1 Tax=Gammaproteobacteria TaxID=1236 RepID=UPI000DCFCA10|nr:MULTISPECIES: hypothetical protein [Gammaproteobacteria]RTE86532.1 hypothetical protein DQX04_08220 [Aliidiomarina sp. B3213]TCZ90913.1 hypothetical protein EYQ95_08825 [Lysobacter sp. N42]